MRTSRDFRSQWLALHRRKIEEIGLAFGGGRDMLVAFRSARGPDPIASAGIATSSP